MNKNNPEININVIGLMSGTSLDGLDICYANFIQKNSKWSYKIIETQCITYPQLLKRQIANAHLMDANSFAQLHTDFGIIIGKSVKTFLDIHSAKPEIIASHGHTIFHQPEKKLTYQIGNGANIAAETGVSTVCDFRSLDVALNGQGAPLVPIGDKLLFSEYDSCLNLGGFSNISFNKYGKRIAYDICPVNFVLNYYMMKIGKDFDKDGMTARSGIINIKLLDRLNDLNVYKNHGPKSLAREDVEKEIIPLIDSFNLNIENKLATYCEHIAIQISKNIPAGKIIITGGGAFNKFLIERIKTNSPNCTIYIPDDQTINYKEALIFAFLGVLYLYDIPNCLSSVTGAISDSIGGALYKSLKLI